MVSQTTRVRRAAAKLMRAAQGASFAQRRNGSCLRLAINGPHLRDPAALDGALRALDVACIEPRLPDGYGEGHALHYTAEIADCFGGAASVGEVVARLEAGGGLWHAQARQALLDASPLALRLTWELLRRAAPDGGAPLCWTEVNELEAAASARWAAEAPDAAAGAAAEAAAAEAPPRWEHASIDDVSDDALRRYLPAA